jgi:glucosyl-3-phosphoglycerate synthase
MKSKILNLLKNIPFFRKQKITVVIPVLNEEKTIYNVIRLAKKSKNVDEVVIIDDNSVDNTVNESKRAGAIVYTSSKIGKGVSMREGLNYAKNEIIAYIDGDIDNYDSDIIKKITDPIIYNKYDFVKTTFDREAGRVTELVAKPLLSILFPELTEYSQPLSGMIAAKKKYLQKVTFENDYGVDIGILIDMYNNDARIKEVHVGTINNKSQPWQALGKMSREVSRAILKRAKIKNVLNLDDLEGINIIQDEMETSINESILKLNKMVIFDMDNTILMGRFIYESAKKLGFEDHFYDVLSKNNEPYLLTKHIAMLFKGIQLDKIIEIIESMKIIPDVFDVIKKLKDRGYIIGIISDSYDVITGYIQNKIGADFSLSNELEIKKKIATGEVKIPSYFIKTGKSICNHNICKSNALIYLSEKYNIEYSNMIAIGDGENDICMIKQSGIGVAFCSENKILNAIADKKITNRNFKEILTFAL